MKKEQAERWAEVRAAGRWSFVLRTGVLRWGLLMTGLLVGRRIVEEPSRFLTWLAVGVPLCFVGGVLFGLFVWGTSEWQYRRHLAAEGAETATTERGIEM